MKAQGEADLGWNRPSRRVSFPGRQQPAGDGGLHHSAVASVRGDAEFNGETPAQTGAAIWQPTLRFFP